MIRPVGAGRRLSSFLIATLVLLATVITWSASSTAAPNPGTQAAAPDYGLQLASQTSWVGGGGTSSPDLHLGLKITAADAVGTRLQMSVYSRLVSRSDFAQTLDGKVHGVMQNFGPVAVSTLTTGAAGVADIDIAVNPTAARRASETLRLSTPGIYPVQAVLLDRAGQTQARVTTHLLFTGKGPFTQSRLDVGWVMPVHAPPTVGSDGQPGRLDPANSQSVADVAGALAGYDRVPVTLAPTGQTLDALSGGSETDKASVSKLAQAVGAGHEQVLARPYVAVNASTLTAEGMDSELTAQLNRSRAVVGSTLRGPVGQQTWLETGTLSTAGIDSLAGRGVTRMIVEDDGLSPLPSSLTTYTPAQPFELAGREGRRVAAVSLDRGLSAHFNNGADQVLAAHQLLADLAMIQAETPNVVRGVAMTAPATWRPDAAFLSVALEGLAASPLLAPVTIDQLFTDVAPVQQRRITVVRSAVVPQVAPDPTSAAAEIRAVRSRLEGFASVVPGDATIYNDIDRVLLIAASSDLRDRQRPGQVATATRLLDRQLQMIHLPPDQSITLTARQGSIPITVVSTAPYNPFVRIKLSSTKLKFHDIVVVGGTCQPGATAETCVLTLHNENTTLKVPVNAPTPGVFRLTVDLESANGALSFAHTQYTVRSTAASGVGIFLSIGAALLLVLWWIRDLRHGRRARRLVPSEDDEPALHAAQAGPEFGSDEWLYRQLGLEWPPPEVSQPAGSLAANRSTPLIVRPIVPLTPAPDLDPITAPIPIISLRGPAVAPAAPPRPAERAPVAAPGTRVRTGEGGGSDRTQVAPPPPPRVPSGRTARGRDRDLPAAFGHNTTVMAAGTMLSRLTGFARVLAVIWAFHLLGLADAYNLANNVPNILYDLVLGGVLSATLVPVFVDYLGREDKDEGWRAVSAVCTAIFAVLLVLTALFFLLVPVIIRFYLVLNHGAGVADERAIGTTLLRLFVPQLFILGGIAVTTALLNARRHFLAPAFSPVFNNLITIAAVVAARLVASSLGPKSFRHDTTALLILGLGTTAGYLVQLLMQLPPMLRGRVRLRPVWDLHHPAVRTVLRLSLWTFGAVVANQVAYNLVLVFAARKTGDVTVFQTAYTFFQLPYAIFAVSIASVITPDLSERWARGDVAGFRRQMASGLRLTLTFLIPAAVGYVLLAHPLLTLILRHGTFSAGDAHKIGTVVALFAVGLPGFSAYLLLMRGYQAMQDTRSMFWLYVIENAATIVLALALYPVMGVSGLALGWVSAYTLGTAVTFFRLRRRTGGLEGLATARTLLRVGMASVVMAGAVWAVRVGFNGVSDARLAAEILGGAAVGTVIYVMFCRALGVAEVDLLLRRRRS